MSGVFVLDSFALLAYFEDEAGAERVQHILAQAEKGRASLAIARKARLVTGYPEFRRLEKDIPIDWLAR